MYIIIIIVIVIIIIIIIITIVVVIIISTIFKYIKQYGMPVSRTSGLQNPCGEMSTLLSLIKSRK
jgi:hypothetical protein